MTDKEVLQKAIEIAIDNGLKTKDVNYYTFNRMVGDVMFDDVRKDSWAMLDTYDCYNLLFSHDFAKAFFTGLKPKPLTGQVYDNSYYHDVELHLMQMVICDNPIDYLRKFIDNTEKTD
jgi:hypothetical protein